MEKLVKRSFKAVPAMAVAGMLALMSVVGASAQESVEARLAALEARIQELERELAVARSGGMDATVLPANSPGAPLQGAYLRPAVLTTPGTLAMAAAAAAAPQADAPDTLGGDLEGLNFFKGITFGGFLDTYYTYNVNQPPSGKVGLRNFDFNHNSLTLNQADFEMTKAVSESSPLGFNLQMAFGPTADWVNSGDYSIGNATGAHFMQYYLSGRIPTSRGITIDVGKFVTQHGAEVIDNRANWNYSRGILFAWAIPYYHFGVRATLPVADTLTLGASLSNGWNNVVDNNGGKTAGFLLSWNPGPVSFLQNYMVGPEQAGNSDDIRHLFDSLLTVKVGDQVTFLVNYDYGMDRVGGAHVHWQGVAAYLRYQPNPKFALTPRFEYFDDRMGFSTGTAQILREFTLTPEFIISDNLVTRLEWRRDWSNRGVFEVRDAGDDPAVQHTVGVGLLLKF
ncbi:MAG TPA: outer membrane beta-barrel protein [Terriglobia bacterium]|nr:outer membrane beta-barrel protein [Terriglobia bacterium]